tara:strand:+ start:598 stop:1194 length:597 start_codon:yes stop_codon:yes gene_type:complete
MKIVVATTNDHKVREIRQIFSDLPYSIESIKKHVKVSAPEETGSTFEENARLKALYYSSKIPQLTVAEDSGLQIDGLDGAPGIHSARYPGVTYQEKFKRIYTQLHERGLTTSPARFICTVALAKKQRIIFESQGVIEGHIAEQPAGIEGFGYDPIFFYPPFSRTLAELTPKQKSRVSHRGQAFRTLHEYLASHDNAKP